MVKDKEQDDVASPGHAHEMMSPKWMKVEHLLGGTEAMRSAGEYFLPRYEEESQKRYEVRLAMTTLLNMFRFTLRNLAGRVFKNPIVLNEDVPQVIKDLAEDIDGQGNHIQVVAYRLFQDGLGKGLSHVLLDMPKAQATADGRPLTRADDARRKPYWSMIAPENLLFAHSEVVDGEERLTMVRILEESMELVGFREVCTMQVRVLRPGSYEVWRYVEDRKGNKDWYIHDAGEMGVRDDTGRPYIPLVTFYTKRKGLMLSEVPLEDLADLNIEHWQSKSDQRNILTAARFPMLAVSGSTGEDDETGKKVNIGPYTLLSTPDPQGKFYYVEHTGAAIQSGRTDLKDIEEHMASYGAQFLKKKADVESATSRILDSTETISELQALALNFKDVLERALQVTADWLGEKSGGSINLDVDLSLNLAGSDVQALSDARRNRDISRQTYLGEFKRRKVLADDFDEELNDEQLLEENSLGLNDPNNPNDPGTGGAA